ncbi:MAG: HEAT repeat domain-containing protein [Ignavibacteriae bacterium]|nr:MAG: HEAT repeat domain-containing protein [Ignavibacteriota bacterium]
MDKTTKDLVCLLLTDPDPDVRRRAAEDLAAWNDRNVLAVLSIALQDENKGVADAVSRSFLALGGAPAARAIVYHIEDEDIASRNLAAKLLVKLGESSVHALVPYLRSSDKDVRKLAVDILGEIKSREPIYYLLPLLNDADANVIVSALEALGNIGSESVIRHIIATFELYPFAHIVAIEALGKIGGAQVRNFLESKFTESQAAEKTDGLYLFALLDAIGTVGDGGTLELLLAHYDNFKDHLRDVLLHEIVQIIERCNLEFQFDEWMQEDLLSALRSDNQHIQLSAAKGLVQFKGRDITRALLLSLGISEEMDFVVIVQMSARPAVFQIALACLEEGVSRGRIQMIMLLGKLATEMIHSYSISDVYSIDDSELQRTFAVITASWQDASQEDREIVADTLFRIDCDSTVSFLDQALNELDPWSRAQMIDQLSTMPTRRALECIARFVDDENDMVQEAAVAALRAAGLPAEMGSSISGKEPLDRGADESV